MYHKLQLIATLLLLTLLTACHKDEIEPAKPKDRRTVILYMMAENSLANYTSSDLREILSAKDQIPLDCNLVVYLDDTQMPAIYTYAAATGRTEWKTYPEQNSCDGETFRNVLKDITDDFPAEHYGLIMWSHGSGWIPSPKASLPHKTIGIDNMMNSGSSNTGSELAIPEMRARLEQLGIHWDYIFFDACFMQCVEVDYELRNVCDYVIASPAEIPGEGAPYHQILSSLFLDEGAAEEIARIYHKANTNVTYDFGSVRGGLIISVSQSSTMQQLAATMKPYIQQLFSGRQEYDMGKIQKYCDFSYQSSWKPEYFDLGSAMNLLLQSPSDYENLMRQMDQAYPLHLQSPHWLSIFFPRSQGTITDEAHIASVSMFLPHSKYDPQGYNQRLHDYQWYTAAGWDTTGW